MFDKLEDLLFRYEEVLASLSDPAVLGDSQAYKTAMKEQAELMPIAEAYREYKAAEEALLSDTKLLETEKDEEMRSLIKEEIQDARKEKESAEQKLRILLLPKDPMDEKNVIMEIRAGAGGEEAALFAADLYRMYLHFAEDCHYKVETVEYNETGIGGASKITLMISGKGAYSRLKFESGVHRVQRVPKTESGGRIHTSTATVAVMPEADDVDVEIDMNDIRFDVFRSSGNGGQSVNTTDSAVRLTHIPTGIVISCQDEKSQLKNKDKALKVLRARLYDMKLKEKQEQEAEHRRSLIGSGDRSEKIRTYNFPQGRVTDHRINLTLYKIEAILNGSLEEFIDQLTAAEQAEQLAHGG